jgi:hypothetical protein
MAQVSSRGAAQCAIIKGALFRLMDLSEFRHLGNETASIRLPRTPIHLASLSLIFKNPHSRIELEDHDHAISPSAPLHSASYEGCDDPFAPPAMKKKEGAPRLVVTPAPSGERRKGIRRGGGGGIKNPRIRGGPWIISVRSCEFLSSPDASGERDILCDAPAVLRKLHARIIPPSIRGFPLRLNGAPLTAIISHGGKARMFLAALAIESTRTERSYDCISEISFARVFGERKPTAFDFLVF